MTTIEKLTELLARFPGIGPRQARRIVYYLLTQNQQTLEQLADALRDLKKYTTQCSSCYRYFTHDAKEATLCPICADPNRSSERLMIVEKDVDFENIERSSVFDGKYFILGGTVSLFEKDPGARLHTEKLKRLVSDRKSDLKEIILALSATPAGDETAIYIADMLKSATDASAVSVSRFGRGLSTGSELEYSDVETIKNAYKSRT